ncbi:MAG: protein kinase [archaeon]|nr:protein kinase [archaeon]
MSESGLFDAIPASAQIAIEDLDFTSLQLLGKGAYAQVFRGKYQGKDVAVKRSTLDFSAINEGEEVLRFMMKEVPLWLQLDHPNVIKLLGFHKAEDFLLVMELAEVCLKHYLHPPFRRPSWHPVPWDECLRYSSHTVAGLQYLHARDIIHRDLKAENVLLSFPQSADNCSRVAMLADFGISRKLNSDGFLQTLSLLPRQQLGTPGWMAPEILASPSAQSKPIDVYALGVTLYEVLQPSRQWGYGGLAPTREALLRHERPPAPPADSLDPSQALFFQLVGHCWAQHPDDRPSLGFVAAVLQSLIAHDLPAASAVLSTRPLPYPASSPKAAPQAPDAPVFAQSAPPAPPPSSDFPYGALYPDLPASSFNPSALSLPAYILQRPSSHLPAQRHVVITGHHLAPIVRSSDPSFAAAAELVGADSSASAVKPTQCPRCLNFYGFFFNRQDTCRECKRTICRSCVRKCPCLVPNRATPRAASPQQGLKASGDYPLIERDGEQMLVTCFMLPFVDQEIFWLGFQNGVVGVSCFANLQALTVVYCNPLEALTQRVNSMVYCCSEGGEGAIWSASEGGTISVWSSRVHTVGGVLEANCTSGMMHISFGSFNPTSVSAPSSPVLTSVRLENGVLTWQPVGASAASASQGRLDITSEVIQLETTPDSLGIHIFTETQQDILLSILPRADAKPMILQWYTCLKNVLDTARSGPKIVRLATHQMPPYSGVFCLQRTGHTVWSAGTDFVLNEWGMVESSDMFNAGKLFFLEARRSIKIDITVLPPNVRTICGFVEVSPHVLWVIVGDRWLVLDLTKPSSPRWFSAPQQLAKFCAHALVHGPSGTPEIWTGDVEGRLCVWSVRSDPATGLYPEFDCELGRDRHDPESLRNNRVYQIAQPSQNELWMATNSGFIEAWSIRDRSMLPPALQPLPRGHAQAHSKAIWCIENLSRSSPNHSSVVWTSCRDQSLRRIRWS